MTYTLNTQSADEHAQGAAISAYLANKRMQCTYTREQQTLAQRLLDVLGLGLVWDTAYTNYRKKFIAVKLTGVRIVDQHLGQQAIECAEHRGYRIETTAQGMIFRIPR
jgi:hypothetical protein